MFKLILASLFLTSTMSLVMANPVEPHRLSALEKRLAEPVTPSNSPFDDTTTLDKRATESMDLLPEFNLLKRQAGLFWGPVYIGNLKLYLTNSHSGYAGPKFPNAAHVNFHVDKEAAKGKYTAVVNMHIVKYSKAGKFCLYAWDSVTKKTVFDKCFDGVVPAISACVSAIKNTVDEIIKAANFIAAIAIIAALVFALTAALTGLAVVAA
jgi:hypothetical protein